MSVFKNITVFTLIAAVLFVGVPVFQHEDASRDRSVDLKDAILLVKVFKSTAGDRADLKGGMRGMISALKVSAGMDTVIKGCTEQGIGNGLPGIDMTSPLRMAFPTAGGHPIIYLTESRNSFISVKTTPPVPPPRCG